MYQRAILKMKSAGLGGCYGMQNKEGRSNKNNSKISDIYAWVMMIVVMMNYSASTMFQVHPCFIYFHNLLKYIFFLHFTYEETEIKRG